MAYRSGHHFLHVPGPSNVPERVLRAMDRAVIDHRGADFGPLALEVLAGMKALCFASGPVILYPSSGTGAWEAALTNTLNPGDKVLCSETGQFSTLWAGMAKNLGFQVEVLPGDWRHAADPEAIGQRLRADKNHEIKGILVVHSDTSTGVCSRLPEIRAAIDEAGHPGLLFVDTVSSLAVMEYRHDDWKVDVMIGGSQKGLMMPPGVGFNVLSQKALEAHKRSTHPRAYFDWTPILAQNETGYYPYTSPTLFFFGLREALKMIVHEEGVENTWARHARLATAARAAARGWGLDIIPVDEREYSNALTAVIVPDGVDADAVRKTAFERFDLSLAMAFGPWKGRAFRIGHLGSINELMLLGALAGAQMALRLHGCGTMDGVNAAMEVLGAESGVERVAVAS